MECELCGKKVEHLRKTKIDGAIMAVCQNCEKFGTPIDKFRVNPSAKVPESKPVFVNTAPQKVYHSQPLKRRQPVINVDEMEIVPEFAEIIKESREKTGLTQDEFAAKLKEKRTSIAAIERGSLKPDIKTARKIEAFLKVKLLEKY
jgi:putative transcription factor